MMFRVSSEGDERFTEIHELATPSTVLALLECPICKDVPFPPIYNCERGHIICSICRPKLNYCALCKGSFSGRNFPIEAIVLSSTHICKYKANGCSAVLKGEEMLRHLAECRYKGLCTPCHLGQYTSCSHKLVSLPLPKYLHHLKEGHMMLPSISGTPGTILFDSHVLIDVKDTFWLGDYTIYDKHTFVIRQFMRNQLVYFSLAVLGDEATAKKYVADVTIVSQVDKISKISWTIPTHSIMWKEEEIMDKACGVVPFSYLKSHGHIASHQGKKQKVSFSVNYKMYNREA